MADAHTAGFAFLEVGIEGRHGQLIGLKGAAIARPLTKPGCKLAEDTGVDINGARRFGLQRRRIGSEQIWGRLG
jgi:hypothetical protein